MIKKGLSAIKQKEQAIKKEIREKTIGYILAALGLVAGLAWNEAIKGMINVIFPNSNNGLFIKLLYAIIVTIIVVIISMYLGSLIRAKEEITK